MSRLPFFFFPLFLRFLFLPFLLFLHGFSPPLLLYFLQLNLLRTTKLFFKRFDTSIPLGAIKEKREKPSN
jgi:hypothetical protein